MLMAVEKITADRVIDSVEMMFTFVFASATEGKAVHEVERDLWRRLLELGHILLGEFLALHGTGDLGETWQDPQGHVLHRLVQTHTRQYRSIFGSYILERAVYGTREKQRIEFVPLDTRLRLPESEYSYVLQGWCQSLDVEDSYAHTAGTLQDILGMELPVDSLERGCRQMAQSVDAFRQSLAPPPPAEEAQILVATVDGKGIPMIRPADDLPAGVRRKKGEKANKKKMAAVGCVYTVDPRPRKPQDVIKTLFREGPARSPDDVPEPAAVHKRVWACLTQKSEDEVRKGESAAIEWMAGEAKQRLGDRKKIVCLTDGQLSLGPTVKRLFSFIAVVQILDLMHAASRLWEAAYLFHAENSPEARQFVRSRLLRVLQGKAACVIRGLRQMGSKQDLRGAKRKRLDTICGYLHKNLPRMRYNEYLAAGYPIATGVIEGACRYYIKDRMERAGMRWTEKGAQAILDLRATYINGHWEDFQAFRVNRENRRMYPHVAAVETIEWPFREAA